MAAWLRVTVVAAGEDTRPLGNIAARSKGAARGRRQTGGSSSDPVRTKALRIDRGNGNRAEILQTHVHTKTLRAGVVRAHTRAEAARIAFFPHPRDRQRPQVAGQIQTTMRGSLPWTRRTPPAGSVPAGL